MLLIYYLNEVLGIFSHDLRLCGEDDIGEPVFLSGCGSAALGKCKLVKLTSVS
jgi:hypothetical protein